MRTRDLGATSNDAFAWLIAYTVLLFAIPSRLVLGPLGSAGAPSMLFGLTGAFLWILAQLWRTHPTPQLLQTVRGSLWLFGASAGISYVIAMAGPIAFDEISPADVAMISMVSWAGVMLVAHDGLRDLGAVERVVRAFVLVGGLMASVGLAQYVTRQVLVDRISIPGLQAVSDIEAAFRNGVIRISGTATSPIEFGALLSILFPLAAHVALHPAGLGPLRRWLPVATIGAALVLSNSRSAYLGLAVGLVVLFCGWPRQLRRRVLVVTLTLGTLTVLAVPPLFRSVRSMFLGASEDPSITSRTDSYGVAWQFFSEAPLFGHGLGTFLPKYRILDNAYLGLAIGVGLVGTVAFFAILGSAVVVLLRRRRRLSDPRSRDLALALVAAVVAGATSFAFFDAFGFPMTTGTLFLTLGLAGAFGRVTAPRWLVDDRSVTPGGGQTGQRLPRDATKSASEPDEST